MSAEKIKQVLLEGCDIVFVYNGKNCGISPECHDSQFTFDAWFGEENNTYEDVDEVLTDKFYAGKSLADVVKQVEVDIY